MKDLAGKDEVPPRLVAPDHLELVGLARHGAQRLDDNVSWAVDDVFHFFGKSGMRNQAVDYRPAAATAPLLTRLELI